MCTHVNREGDFSNLSLILYMKFGPCQLSCLSSLFGKAVGLENRVLWQFNFSLENTSSGELNCFALFSHSICHLQRIMPDPARQ